LKRLNGNRPVSDEVVDHVADLVKARLVDIARSCRVSKADGASKITAIRHIDYRKDRV
jgi:hypothetical protein